MEQRGRCRWYAARIHLESIQKEAELLAVSNPHVLLMVCRGLFDTSEITPLF